MRWTCSTRSLCLIKSFFSFWQLYSPPPLYPICLTLLRISIDGDYYRTLSGDGPGSPKAVCELIAALGAVVRVLVLWKTE